MLGNAPRIVNYREIRWGRRIASILFVGVGVFGGASAYQWYVGTGGVSGVPAPIALQLDTIQLVSALDGRIGFSRGDVDAYLESRAQGGSWFSFAKSSAWSGCDQAYTEIQKAFEDAKRECGGERGFVESVRCRKKDAATDHLRRADRLIETFSANACEVR